MATARDTAFYSAVKSKYLIDRQKGGLAPLLAIPFEVTVVSVSAVGDTYNLCVIPANARVVGFQMTSDGAGASAAVTVEVGDAGAVARYCVLSAVNTTSASIGLAIAGQGYTPTADTIAVLTVGAGALTVGKVIKGHFTVIAGY